MQALRKSEEAAFAADQDWSSEFKDAAGAEAVIAIDGNWTGGAGTLGQDPALKLLGRLELNHNGPRVAMDSRLLYFASAFLEQGVRDLSSSVAGATGDFLAKFSLPFQRTVPRGGFDAVGRPATVKGRFRGGNAILTGGATVSVNTRVRPTFVVARAAPPAGFRDPAWTQESVPCGTSSVSANTRKIEFGQDMVVPMLVCMALDADGELAGLTDRTLRTDGLVQRLSIERHGEGGSVVRLVDDISWGTLRARTAHLARWGQDDVNGSVGIVVIPLSDPNQPDGLLRMPAGTHLTVICDTASTIERGYTDVAPALGDSLEVGVLAFHAQEKQTPREAQTVANISARATTRGRRLL